MHDARYDVYMCIHLYIILCIFYYTSSPMDRRYSIIKSNRSRKIMGARGKEPNRRNPLSQRVLFDVIFMFSEGFLLFGLMEMFTVKTAWFAGKLQSIHIISHPWTCFLGFSSQWLDGGIFAQGTSKLEDLLRQAFKTIPSEKKWKTLSFLVVLTCLMLARLQSQNRIK